MYANFNTLSFVAVKNKMILAALSGILIESVLQIHQYRINDAISINNKIV